MKVRNDLLSEFDITEEQYRKWLKIIFYMVVPFKLNNGKTFNFATELINKIFNPKNKYIEINLAIHDKEVCLLSDRGHVDFSKTLPGNSFGYRFNLTKNAFISFTFIENKLENWGEFFNIPKIQIARMKEGGLDKIKTPPLKIDKCINKDSILSTYNSSVIYQCHTYFYAANKTFLKK
jgi:hypothetical protein